MSVKEFLLKKHSFRQKKVLSIVGVVMTLITVVLIFELFNLSVLKYDYYQKEVIDQITLETTVSASRGTIYDRNGNILATNSSVWLLFISPQHVIERMEADEAARTLYYAASEKERADMEITWEYTVTDVNGNSRVLDLDDFLATEFSRMFELDYDKIIEKCAKKGSRYSVIKNVITDEQADVVRAIIKKYGLVEQIYVRATTQRYYPKDTLASNVLGFLNSDGMGIYGLEKEYNDILEGSSGKYITAQDAHNNDMPFEFETYIAAEDGCNVVTTLDMYIQYELENALEETCNESGGTSAIGIVMDVNTGGVLGIAQYPSYNSNDPYSLSDFSLATLNKSLADEPDNEKYDENYLNALYDVWSNKAISWLYEPGSTSKVITAAIALENNAVKVDDRFYCSGKLYVEGYGNISCHRVAGHGSVTFAEGLQQSCNPTLMTVADRIGREIFYKYFTAFGYTSRTGIDLPAESIGLFADYNDFHNVELAVYSFGQTYKVTPIQQLTAICSVANGGYLVTPHLMSQITDASGNVVETYTDKNKRQVVSEETCDILTQILEEGVSGNGGAKNAYVSGYRVAAKTGTSQKQDKYDEYGERPYRVGSCVAFAPADDPQVAVLILVDEPTIGSVYGSVVAAPYVSGLLGYILPYLGVEPQYNEEEEQNIEVSIGNYVGATLSVAESDLSWREIKYEIIGEGDTVTAQVPKSGSTISKENGKLLLYCGSEVPSDDIVIPDLVGKTAEAANRLLTNLGLNIKIEGSQNTGGGDSATVISQSPAAGESVSRATVVTIELRHLNVTD